MAEDPSRDPASDPPREVSDQNREEPSAPQSGARREPSEPPDTSRPPDSERSSESGEGRPGGAGEGSQASGHPENAG